MVQMYLARSLRRRNNRINLVLAVSLCILILCRLLLPDCRAKTFINHDPVTCMYYRGQLGNLMFIHAYHYLFSKKHDMNMVKTGTFNLQDVFDLGENFSFDESFRPSYCGCYTVLENEFDCGFDPKLNLWSNRKGVYLSGYFQSWRYFIQEENEIRRMFTFKKEIRTRVALQLRNLLRGTNWNYDTHQLVGVHIRRGDFTAPPEAAFGYITAPIDYVTRAMHRMRSFYSRVIFLVCSDEILWAKKRLDKEPDVLFSEDNTAAEDLALLSLTNHTIITVGTFGWWAAFLTNGTTIYYKHAFVKNSKLAAQYPNESTEDFFPPAWIGME